ncbi:hypothetical protein M0D21_05495 [Aquimarina sp. D1M17]|uniref:hypothetical protein n=1 Tax=Aquimarina acroporae TaxID=2937283 RepID=UPI0020C09CF3|nr:hypothetical protein [Aquimarina acroporae]MCK8521009.1 hypothetical protein [Aquimarina acroporae]
MQYRNFFDIEIIHPCLSEIAKDIVLVPKNETRKHLNALGFIFKKTEKGIRVLAPISKGNESILPLNEDDNFTFYVYPTSYDTQEITDFSEIDEGNMISFSNQDSRENIKELIVGQAIQEGVFNGYSALANIVIKANLIDTSSPNAFVKFKAIFGAKSVKWKYYFVSNTKETDINLESRDNQISFNEIVVGENTTDQIINSIQLNFPDTQIKVFESKDLVPYSSVPIKNIKLLQDGDVLISHLPNPRIEQQGVQIIKIK